MWPIIKWTLWQRRWVMLWWCIGIISLIVLTLALYPIIRDQASQLNKSFSGLPSSTLALFGGTDFFSPIGYLNSQLIYLTLPLILTILGLGLGSSLIGKEEADGTIETILSRPISRTKLLASKAIAGTLNIFIVTFIALIITILLADLVNMGIPLGNISLAFMESFLLILTFSSVAFLLSASGRGRVAALGISVAYAMGGYIVGSLATTVHWLKGPSLIFAYHYYRSAEILEGNFRWSSIIFYTALIISCFILSLVVFRSRDLE